MYIVKRKFTRREYHEIVIMGHQPGGRIIFRSGRWWGNSRWLRAGEVGMNAAAGGRNGNRFSRLKRDNELRSLAMDLVVQLPKDEADALRVLEYARFLVADFRSGNVPDIDPASKLSIVP